MSQIKGICLFLILLNTTHLIQTANATELSVKLDSQALSVIVNDIDYPESLVAKELKSGLPNDINILINIRQGNTVIFATTVNYSITYDLWDEVFVIRSVKGEQPPTIERIEQQEIERFIQSFHLTSEKAHDLLKTNLSYHLQMRVLANPVNTERINKIKAWIASSQGHKVDEEANNKALIVANTTPAARGGQAPATGISQSTNLNTIGSARPRFQKLFDQILEQYITEDEIPALWSSEVITLQFSLDNLHNATKDN